MLFNLIMLALPVVFLMASAILAVKHLREVRTERKPF